jgi:hypothetical protein
MFIFHIFGSIVTKKEEIQMNIKLKNCIVIIHLKNLCSCSHKQAHWKVLEFEKMC